MIINLNFEIKLNVIPLLIQRSHVKLQYNSS